MPKNSGQPQDSKLGLRALLREASRREHPGMLLNGGRRQTISGADAASQPAAAVSQSREGTSPQVGLSGDTSTERPMNGPRTIS